MFVLDSPTNATYKRISFFSFFYIQTTDVFCKGQPAVLLEVEAERW